MNKNLYTNGFFLIFKIYFHNISGAPFENHGYTVANGRMRDKVERIWKEAAGA
jgi:hypothetical protein